MTNDKGIFIKNVYYMLSYAFRALRQYRYAKDYYQLVMQRLAKTEGQEE